MLLQSVLLHFEDKKKLKIMIRSKGEIGMATAAELLAKYSTEIVDAEIIPEIVRQAFKDAEAEKPGGYFIKFS